MENQNPLFKRLVLLSVTLLLATGCSSFTNPSASYPGQSTELRQTRDANPKYENRIQRHVYAGIGFGSAFIEPDTSQVPGVDVNSRVDGAGQITLGLDLSRQLAIELHAADLGSAGISPQGSISYRTFGGSALYYFGKNRHNFKREGFSGFGRLGFAALKNSAEGGVEFEQVNGAHFLLGAGLEYMTRIGLGLRLEGIAFEEDARFAQLGLIYRLGRRNRTRQLETVSAPAPVIPAPMVAPSVPAVVVAPVVEEIPYDSCSEFRGTLEGVKFQTNSAQLTPEAGSILQEVAVRLAECPSTPIGIASHTDSVGDDGYNQTLSYERAISVSKFLVDRGIDVNRIEARAFGETQPIDSNETAAGRERNRRVELFTR